MSGNWGIMVGSMISEEGSMATDAPNNGASLKERIGEFEIEKIIKDHQSR